MTMICSSCEKNVGKAVIRLERSEFVNHGDHGERFVTLTAVVCSWPCAAAFAESRPDPGGEPW